MIGKDFQRKKMFLDVRLFVLVLFFLFVGVTSYSQAAEPETKVIIHYEAPDKEKDLERTIWLWADNEAGQELAFTGQDKFGKYAEVSVPGIHEKVGFLIKSKGDWSYQSPDQWIDTSSGKVHVWLDKDGELSYTPKNEETAPKTDKLNVRVHYYRSANDYDNWNIWYWLEGKDGKQAAFAETDSFGQVAEFELSGEDFSKFNFLIRKSSATNEWEEKDGDDRVVYVSQNQNEMDVWIMEGDKMVYGSSDFIVKNQGVKGATIEKLSQIDVTFTKKEELENLQKYSIKLMSEGKEIQIKNMTGDKEKLTNRVSIEVNEVIDLQKEYYIVTENQDKIPVGLGGVVRTSEFDETYAYDGKLGALYSKEKTDFVLWAPTASQVELVLYQDQTEASPEKESIVMERKEKGTHKVSVLGDQAGTAYTYRLTFPDGKVNESTDPYATSAIVNGNHSVVVNPNEVALENFNRMPAFTNPVDAIIYEAHIRDLSISPDSGIKNKGKFLGVIEEGTKNETGQSTGLDYIKSLGVTHVQFLPMYDYQTIDESRPNDPQYNWGYDPKNYNVPEGSYSTDSTDPTKRVTEMKQMIKGLHDNNIRVIMDVVYNHVYEAGSHAFNKTVPGYYFRYNTDGSYANGTGVGNDVASERKMAQKYIVDSVIYWAENYNLDGFRFDLMGILDVETMNLVRSELDKIDPSIIILGEGWNMGTPLDDSQKAIQKNANIMPGIAHFNDSIRDSVKGSVFDGTEPGMINGKSELEKLVAQNMLGASGLEGYTSPSQVIQYVEAHDNLTLYDKLSLTNPTDTNEQRIKRHSLGTGMMLVSQGVPFIHAGQEFLRTKDGDENSYKSPDSVNQFDWSRPEIYRDSVELFKSLVSYRKNEPLLRIDNYNDIKDKAKLVKAEDNIIIYELKGEEKELLISINANEVEKEIDKQLTKDFKVVLSNQLENETYQEGVMLPLSLTVYEKSLTTEETKTSESKETEETNSTKEKEKETETSTSDSSLTKRNSENLPKTGEKKTIFAIVGLLTLASGFLLFRKRL
ncbi:type I pullulanase [Vagococcus fluvialis]|uniref:type I pullulanase n=1 Tax=Vagococcus fluvialis TaxID=2738 RepID=UPI00379A6D08